MERYWELGNVPSNSSRFLSMKIRVSWGRGSCSAAWCGIDPSLK